MKRELVAVILAGGAGNRFWPFVQHKVLFPWFGKPFLEHSLQNILPKTISRVVCITNNENNAAISSLTFPVPTVTVIQRRAMGMADALLSAASQIENCSLVIINGDDITDKTMISHVVARGLKGDVFGVIPGFATGQYIPGGYLVTDKEKILNIIEKPGEGNEPSHFVALVGHYIADSNKLISELKITTSAKDDVYEKALSVLMKRYSFVMHPYEGSYAGLKYPWNVLDVTAELLKRNGSHRGKNVDIRSNVVLEGDVYIDDEVKIFENTKIIGPSYIGRGTIVGNNNIIRASHIGKDCVTGFSTDITRSYIGDACWFHTNYIGDSVVEGNVSMGSGAVLANLRLDDGEISSIIDGERVPTGRNKLGAMVARDVRIGVNASIMPGMKIGKGSFVGAGVVLDRDLPEETYCMAKEAYTSLRNKKSAGSQNRDEFKKQL
jgi:NDP-sugar pyrophosphorylase family protein